MRINDDLFLDLNQWWPILPTYIYVSLGKEDLVAYHQNLSNNKGFIPVIRAFSALQAQGLAGLWPISLKFFSLIKCKFNRDYVIIKKVKKLLQNAALDMRAVLMWQVQNCSDLMVRNWTTTKCFIEFEFWLKTCQCNGPQLYVIRNLDLLSYRYMIMNDSQSWQSYLAFLENGFCYKTSQVKSAWEVL